MMAKTMAYTYEMAQPVAAVYATIMASQLAYFNSRNAGIHELAVGTAVTTTLRTKTDKAPVAAMMTVTALIPERTFTLKVSYAAGEITTTYQLSPTARGTKVTYSETNAFKKRNFERSFSWVGWAYTLLYRHNIKKRMQWIEQSAAGESKVGDSNDAANI